MFPLYSFCWKFLSIKLLEENTGSVLFDISLSNIWGGGDLSPQARETKAKVDKWDYIKLKSFCPVKETINKMKRPPTEQKTFVNDISNKGLISKIYQKTHKTQCQKTTKQKTKSPKQPDWKMSRAHEDTFFQRRHTDGQQAHEKILTNTNHQGNVNQNHN